MLRATCFIFKHLNVQGYSFKFKKVKTFTFNFDFKHLNVQGYSPEVDFSWFLGDSSLPLTGVNKVLQILFFSTIHIGRDR